MKRLSLDQKVSSTLLLLEKLPKFLKSVSNGLKLMSGTINQCLQQGNKFPARFGKYLNFCISLAENDDYLICKSMETLPQYLIETLRLSSSCKVLQNSIFFRQQRNSLAILGHSKSILKRQKKNEKFFPSKTESRVLAVSFLVNVS